VAKGVTPIGPSDYVPVTKSTVTYIVLVVLINSKDEVLMMQEAKSTCAGQWYLPAGRVEPGENLHVCYTFKIYLNNLVLTKLKIFYFIGCSKKRMFRRNWVRNGT